MTKSQANPTAFAGKPKSQNPNPRQKSITKNRALIRVLEVEVLGFPWGLVIWDLDFPRKRLGIGHLGFGISSALGASEAAFHKVESDYSAISPLNLTAQQKIRLGACAWSFEEWRGSFYPSDLPAARWLEFYSHYFPAVEIDSTFYHPPAEGVVRRWVEHTPASFRFACKLPREITHVRRLRECKGEVAAFLRAIEPLESKLQVILIQLPPSFAPKDGRTPLREFLEGLPR